MNINLLRSEQIKEIHVIIVLKKFDYFAILNMLDKKTSNIIKMSKYYKIFNLIINIRV